MGAMTPLLELSNIECLRTLYSVGLTLCVCQYHKLYRLSTASSLGSTTRLLPLEICRVSYREWGPLEVYVMNLQRGGAWDTEPMQLTELQH